MGAAVQMGQLRGRATLAGCCVLSLPRVSFKEGSRNPESAALASRSSSSACKNSRKAASGAHPETKLCLFAKGQLQTAGNFRQGASFGAVLQRVKKCDTPAALPSGPRAHGTHDPWRVACILLYQHQTALTHMRQSGTIDFRCGCAHVSVP